MKGGVVFALSLGASRLTPAMIGSAATVLADRFEITQYVAEALAKDILAATFSLFCQNLKDDHTIP